jgi:pilus assembly protein CpaB
VILTNVQVLAAGTKIDRETDKNKPMPVSVVTMLVNPEEAERLTLASTEGKIQLALRNPLDKTIPATPGVRPSALFGLSTPTRTATARTKVAAGGPAAAKAVAAAEPVLPTVEIIRGDKRAHEVVRQEQ